MNPLNGIVISKFKVGAESNSDIELLLMGRYLDYISRFDDLSILDHSKWRETTLANLNPN